VTARVVIAACVILGLMALCLFLPPAASLCVASF